MKKNIFFVAITSMAIASSLIATSCSKGGDDEKPVEPVVKTEIRLSTVVEKQTRASFTGADTQISDGQSVSVWVNESTATATPLYEKNTLKANGSGSLSGGTTMYFPQSGSNVDIYALHTNATLTGNTYPTAALTHTVNADQKTLTNYAVSDLLYTKATNIAETTKAVPLTFYHLLSKLQVAIVPGDGLTAADITGITINGTKLQAGFTLSKASNPNAIAVSAAGSVASIKVGTDVSSNFTSPTYNDAIIVPQKLAKGTAFITLRLAEGIDLAYLLPEDTTFESRKKYTYHVTVSRTEITITTSITDWESGGLVTGEASHLVN